MKKRILEHKKKIVLVADCKTWAFGFISQRLKALLQGTFEIEIIYTEEYTSFRKFLEDLVSHKADLVHFFWRGYLLEAAKTAAQRKLRKVIASLNKTAITTHVPEHLFIHNESDVNNYLPIFHIVDEYFCTSKKLANLYKEIPFYPLPWGVIHDITTIKKPTRSFERQHDEAHKPISIAWVGNSRWCSDIGFIDPKGPYTVIEPAIQLLRDRGIDCIFNNYDKVKEHLSREEILNKLLNTDILTVASFTEGTPLPLLEGMASGCAIVTTDTGIAKEVLPQVQQPFVISRDPKSFADTIESLHKNRTKLASLQKANYTTYWNDIASHETQRLAWKQFFLDAIQKSAKTESVRRKALVFDALTQFNALQAPSECPKLTYTQKIRRRLNRPFSSNKDGFTAAKELAGIYLDRINSEKPSVLCIYSPYWHGVRNSSRGLFKNRIPFPYAEKASGIKHLHQSRAIQHFLKNGPRPSRIVISGGDPEQFELAKILRKDSTYKPEIYLLYHGSPAQWSEEFFYEHFRYWAEGYKNDIIDGFVLLREDLEPTFKHLGYPAFTLKNFIPTDLDLENCAPVHFKNEFSIGFWSASSWWGKNLLPQLIAAQIIPEATLHTNCTLHGIRAELLDKRRIKSFPESMRRECLREAMANTHLTLYTTYTECSPMVALESLAVGTPCIVGPTSFLYKDDPVLEHYLTVVNTDSAWTIRNAICNVMNNYEEVCDRVKKFKQLYNSKARGLLDNFLKSS